MTLYTQDPNFNPDLLKRTEDTEKMYQKTLKGFEISKKNPAECLKRWMFKHPNQLLAFSHNEYPYDLPEGQSHWLLWVRDEQHLMRCDVAMFNTGGALITLLRSFFGNKIYAIWQNEREKQSVKDLTHFHFIVLD